MAICYNLLPKRAITMVHLSKSAVWTACKKSPFLTPVRSAASTLVTMPFVLLPSCTAAKHWRTSERRDKRTTFNWLGVRDSVSVITVSTRQQALHAGGKIILHPCLVNLGEEDDSYIDSDEITSRSNFPESWLWLDQVLPSCPQNTPNW